MTTPTNPAATTPPTCAHGETAAHDTGLYEPGKPRHHGFPPVRCPGPAATRDPLHARIRERIAQLTLSAADPEAVRSQILGALDAAAGEPDPAETVRVPRAWLFTVVHALYGFRFGHMLFGEALKARANDEIRAAAGDVAHSTAARP